MPKLLSVSVVTKDSKFSFKVKEKSTGGQLLVQVFSLMDFREFWYFGLQYVSKGKEYWVKKKSKIVPEPNSKETPIYNFKVKYYPEDLSSELIEDFTKLYFYYDIKHAIVSGSIYCPSDTALLLAAYQALISFGKYNPSIHKPGFINIQEFIPFDILEQYDISNEEWESKIVEIYKSCDKSKECAIMEYLKISQDLEMLGISYFMVKNVKGTRLWLGVDCMGLKIYPYENKLTPTTYFGWNEIHRLFYKIDKFQIKPIDSKEKMLLHTADTYTSKLILDLCTGNHELYARRRRPDTIEIQQMKAKAKELYLSRETEREHLRSEREARELVEKRLREMELTVQQNEDTYTRSQSIMEEYEERIAKLSSELEEEKCARIRLEELRSELESINQQLEMDHMNSVIKHEEIVSERDQIKSNILQQELRIKNFEEERRNMTNEVQVQCEDQLPVNGYTNGKEDSAECEFEPLDVAPNDLRQCHADVDVDHAQRLVELRHELKKSRNVEKMKTIDHQYEENISKGKDKYKTLRAIREGNTKKRVEQFECM